MSFAPSPPQPIASQPSTSNTASSFLPLPQPVYSPINQPLRIPRPTPLLALPVVEQKNNMNKVQELACVMKQLSNKLTALEKRNSKKKYEGC